MAARVKERTGISMPEDIQKVYMKQGGTPHLDGQYTVFGEVTEGLDVVDRIQQMATDKNDRPTKDVRILRVKIISDPFAPKPVPKKVVKTQQRKKKK